MGWLHNSALPTCRYRFITLIKFNRGGVLKYLTFVLLVLVSGFSLAENVSSKISVLRSPSYDPNTIYFKTEKQAPGVSQWFFFQNRTTNGSGCSANGSEGSMNRHYSMLMTAISMNREVYIDYCVNNDGYGLVNYFEMR